MNKPDISELLELAKKATPGPWCYLQSLNQDGEKCWDIADEDTSGFGYIGEIGDKFNAQYIAALSPDKMIALLEYVQGLEEIIEDHKDLITYRGACQ